MAQLSGAIFDCDGTILDSMPMWNNAFAALCGRHGITCTRELQEEVECLSLIQSCSLLHDRYSLEPTPEALLDELHAWVRHEYAHNVREIPGAHEFLQALADAGIPMIIATSTTSAVVREALAVQGLDGYFQGVVCAAEVRDGRDKEYPDVYEEALSRLGTEKAETWVFEDAPFGVMTVRRAGFHVACVHNDHDGRPEDLLRSWADLFSEGYEGLSLEAIRSFDDANRGPVPEA